MRKKLLVTILSSFISFSTIPVYAAGTCTYSGDYISFEYAEDLYGTIKYSEGQSSIHYSCKSFSGNYSVTVNILQFDSYEELTGAGKDEYIDYIIKNNDNTEIIIDSELPETKTINNLEGDITYTKILAESPTGFIIVVLDEKNENPSIIGDMFRNIYNSISATDEWIKNGNELPENPGYERMIFGENK